MNGDKYAQIDNELEFGDGEAVKNGVDIPIIISCFLDFFENSRNSKPFVICIILFVD
jgi:hypothetical protein